MQLFYNSIVASYFKKITKLIADFIMTSYSYSYLFHEEWHTGNTSTDYTGTCRGSVQSQILNISRNHVMKLYIQFQLDSDFTCKWHVCWLHDVKGSLCQPIRLGIYSNCVTHYNFNNITLLCGWQNKSTLYLMVGINNEMLCFPNECTWIIAV